MRASHVNTSCFVVPSALGFALVDMIESPSVGDWSKLSSPLFCMGFVGTAFWRSFFSIVLLPSLTVLSQHWIPRRFPATVEGSSQAGSMSLLKRSRPGSVVCFFLL